MKPFALLILSNLKVKTFDNKDDWNLAMVTLRENKTAFLPLKYHHGAVAYIHLGAVTF